ncbi:hypothetical protein [Brevundimonas naejangsanensis]|uniref:hypothetical protein n=1 Tax=Brevundimonas naejangsanensis TaxID=588932 RepID=UPI003CFF99A6
MRQQAKRNIGLVIPYFVWGARIMALAGAVGLILCFVLPGYGPTEMLFTGGFATFSIVMAWIFGKLSKMINQLM